VGTGTLTFSFGRITPGVGSDFSFAPGQKPPVTINVTPANNTLAGLAAAINASGAGISASVVANAGNATLVLRGADGADNGFIISAAPDVDTPGLARFSHTPGAPTMTRSQTAVDADLTLDGVAVQRASNVIDDLLPGTRLRLNRTTTGASLIAARAPGALAGTMADLADTLNGMRALVADFRKSASNGDAAGALANDPTARAMDQQLVGLIIRPIASANGLRLADLGIRITREGAVQFDEARLASLGDDRQNDAEALLRHISGPASANQPDRLQSIAASMAGALDGMGRRRDNASRAITRAEAQVETLRISLTRQFAAMDAAVASSRAVGQQLQTTIDMWTARD
jgi:flagellar hook-associated protein 2